MSVPFPTCRRRRSTFVAVLVASAKGKMRPSLSPKGANREPGPFLLQTGGFLRTTRGHDGDRGPSGRHLRGKPTAVIGGEGHSPAVAVLLESAAKALELMRAPKGVGP
jgi:hypothetical protein